MKTKDMHHSQMELNPRNADASAESRQASEMQRKVEAAGTPGPEHAILNALVGEWRAEVRCWSSPNARPDVQPGSARADWILDGRFLEEHFEGVWMGKPFHGRTTMGFDKTKGTYASVWISDTQTSIFFSEGQPESDGRVITLRGTSTCPINGPRHVKSVMRLVSSNERIFEMYDESNGQSVKQMEIIYQR